MSTPLSIDKILSCCPNLQCDVDWWNEELNFESVQALGHCNWRLNLCANSLHPNDLRKVSRACTILEGVSLTTCADSEYTPYAFVDALYLKEKTLLPSLELMSPESGLFTDALLLLGDSAGKLRIFSLHCQRQEMGVFDAVANANPLLEDVYITISMAVIRNATLWAGRND